MEEPIWACLAISFSDIFGVLTSCSCHAAPIFQTNTQSPSSRFSKMMNAVISSEMEITYHYPNPEHDFIQIYQDVS
jgi:hypothetical protein